MNDRDVKWLEKLFNQHKEDQHSYLEDKFNGLEGQLEDVKNEVREVKEMRGEDQRDCKDCRLCLERKITEVDGAAKSRDNKLRIDGIKVGAVIVLGLISLIFHQPALAFIMKYLPW